MVEAQEIEAYYDQSHPHYVLHWRLNQFQSMHYGLWWPETKSFGEALLNTQRLMAEVGGIQPTDHVLDAGCGVGGSSVWLAQEKGCRVLGITLSQKQVGLASHLAKVQEQTEKVEFERRDFCDTGLPSTSFDVVWAIESACHANQKADFIGEAFRLLKPGGRLLICDFLKAHDASPSHEAYPKWLDAWAVPGLWTGDQWAEKAKQVGFENWSHENLTQAIFPSARRLFYRFILAFPVQKMYEWLGKPTEVQRKSARSALWQWQALRAGDWEYGLLSATKPIP